MGYLLITNEMEPYFRDVIALMAQHYGCTYRFRYERSEGFDLVGNIQTSAMVGSQAVILLRTKTGKLIPVRRTRIDRVFESRRLVVLEFALLDFPDPSVQPNWVVIENFVKKHAQEDTPGGPLRPLIFQIHDSEIEGIFSSPINDVARDRTAEFDRWMSVVHSLENLNFAKSTCFLFLHSIYEDNVTLLGKNYVKNGALNTGPNATYRLEIASYALPPISSHSDRDLLPEFTLILKTDSGVISTIDESSLVSSRESC